MPRHREGLHRSESTDAGIDLGVGIDESTEVDWEEAPRPAPLWRSQILIPAVLMIAVVAAAWWTVSWLTTSGSPGTEAVPTSVPVSSDQPEPPDPPVMSGSSVSGVQENETIVHVAGQVRTPGIVRLPASSRVVDAVQAAGGPTDEAQLDLVNLAAPLTDGAQILVPGPEDSAPSSPGTALAATGAVGSTGAATVNVNTADAGVLESLPGIGPALAQRIIDHREQFGPFGSLKDLDAVSGIGPAMLERLDGQVSW